MKNLKVGKSKIQGKGLFTTQPFTKGSFIGLAHEDDQPSTMIGKYHNHSETPNAMSVKVGGKRYLVAKRPLKNNEEITTDYRLQPELEQPDQFKRGGIAKLPKMPKPSKKGVLAKGYSRSIEATNRFFTENKLFEKPKSRKNRVFDPNANYQDGGQPRPVQGMPKPIAPLAIRQQQVKPLKNSVKVADQKKYNAVENEIKAKETIKKASDRMNAIIENQSIENKNTSNTSNEDPLWENFAEFADFTGGLSWDDAQLAKEEWDASGNTMPTFGQAMDMFGAVPGLGKLGKLKYLSSAPDALKAAYKYIPWQQILNGVDTVEDVDSDNSDPNIKSLPVDAVKKQYGGLLPKAEYGMPMGAGMSQNYQGRKKFIYEDGGYIETELTDEEIEEYRKGGWIVEDIY